MIDRLTAERFAWLRRGGVLAGTGLAALAVARWEFDGRVRAAVDDLHADAAEAPADSVGVDAVADAPTPVREYLETVLGDDAPRARTVRLRQRGSIRLGDGDDAWRRFTADLHVSTSAPGFVWDASVAFSPLSAVRVVDRYSRGKGQLRARLAGAVPVARAGPSAEMAVAELQRYLAEAVWYPTALIHGRGLTWERVDDRSARATITDGTVSASVTFHVDGRGLVERVTADRYRQETGENEPWTGRFEGYTTVAGRTVPTRAEAAWTSSGRSHPYWRGEVDSIAYDP